MQARVCAQSVGITNIVYKNRAPNKCYKLFVTHSRECFGYAFLRIFGSTPIRMCISKQLPHAKDM